MVPSSEARDDMVRRQIASRGVSDQAVLSAMRSVPRERFLDKDLGEFAYEDTPLPIAVGQTISQPYIVARMIELAKLRPQSRVLEVGAGSGYAAAVMSRIASKVFTIERHATLATSARKRISELGYDNVKIYHRDGTAGLAEEAPFDAIIVSAGGERVPRALCAQLAISGKLVIPIGRRDRQVLKCIIRNSEQDYVEEDHGIVAFVPLVSEQRRDRRPETAAGELDGAPVILNRSDVRARSCDGKSSLASHIAAAAKPSGDYEELSKLLDRYADRKIVLLGEATHGTSEFYQARARITERLVALHGFNIVAVEADWPRRGSL